MPNKNLKRLGLKSGTRPKPLAPRPKVKRDDRSGPTPETKEKLQPDQMDLLIRRGAAERGIDEQHFNSLWEITEGSLAVSGQLGYQSVELDRVGHGSGEMSPRATRLWDIYSYHFSGWFIRETYTSPGTIREWVQGIRPILPTDVPLLLTAAKIWDRCASSYDKERQAEMNTQNRVLTAAL